MSDWDEIELGVFCKLQGGYAFKSNDFVDEGIPVVKIKNIQNRIATLEGSQCYPENLPLNKLEKFKLYNGDVLIAMTGAGSVGRVGRLICDDDSFGLLNQRVGRFDVNEENLNLNFLYYTLTQPRYQEALFMAGSGSGQPNLSPSQIESFKINLPPLSEQKAIAHILGKLDDKIELNRQMNQTLEAMAQALFKSWFVDFDPVLDNALAAGNEIPDELQAMAEKRQLVPHSKKLLSKNPDLAAKFPSSFVFNETLGKWIPEGWEVKSLGDISDKVFSGGTPSTQNPEYWNGEFNWFSSGETRDSFIISTEKFITQKGIDNSSTKLAIKGDILIASAGQGNTRGQTSYNCINTYVNQSVVIVRGIEGIKQWLFFNLKDRYEEMRGISDSHSIRGSLTTQILKGMKVIIPNNKEIIKVFDKLSIDSISKITTNKREVETLTQLRDRLLPELISGRLRVNENYN
ncbi:restriction endonuclease subunit S [Algoriphagus pacificus]|uniref:Restriction endonuclease subunit S n=1 Tax=Algoriphagus pacificus TaxID=2811234 RepID=A0ABS3CIK6_9BACT|nr:restriction endonuclease subunit S [Algoriphagus pacificus]MBN7816934.1 restriction endonuclease subunit S [Algoriphagus pacificus]